MKTVHIAIGMTGLLVAAVMGQNATPGNGPQTNAPVQPLAPVITQATASASDLQPSALPLSPFLTNFTARTAAGITNTLIRQGAWAPGEKEGEVRLPTEQAVLAALNWLQREQQADGSWKGSKEIVTPTLTALALLAYLGHGETPASAGYGANVGKAIHWLLANQEESGRFQGRDKRDYTHLIAALALTEAYGMTLDPETKAAAEKAVALIVKGQHADGGFGYNLDKAAHNDTSYMCWCAQALAAARMTRLDVPGLERAIDKASYAVRQNADPNGGFGESGPGRTIFSGAGVTALQFLSAPHVAEVQKTLALLATNTFSAATTDAPPIPGASRFYASWNQTQAKFQAGGDAFRNWNKSLARELVSSQTQERSLLTGWVALGRWARRSANDPQEVVIQDTCYGALMLEVYYRYLPFGK